MFFESTYLGRVVAQNATLVGGQTLNLIGHALSWLTEAITSISLSRSKPLVAVNVNSVAADFRIPFDISINVTAPANTIFKMAYQGTPFVELSTAVWITTASDMKNNRVVFSIPPSAMNVFDQQAFYVFIASVTQQLGSTIEVTGSAQGVAITTLGTVRLTVPLKTSLALQGVNLADQKPGISDIEVVSGSIVLQVNTTVNGTNGHLGTVSIANLVLHPVMKL
ncbi:hypothetical protein BGZ65_003672 [Modicella reniformis]|uniref:Uncharacterized protein n=1 Tax=Modicella reniformis TaxID=1440133 RepID=A0A9P6M228_9FUNG|nr:hypothetical protein BGZ65_003672 [Modicella reniformis]